MEPNPRAFTKWHWITLGVITLIWWGYADFFGSIFVADFPQHQPKMHAVALACGLALGLLHLLWLTFFRGRQALLFMVLFKLLAIPITIGGGFFALAMGAMGTDSGMDKAAEAIHMLLPFCMIIASAPTTLAALLGAFVGWLIERAKRKKAAAEAGAQDGGKLPPPQ